MKILYYFATYKWYFLAPGHEPVSIHPNDLKEIVLKAVEATPEADGYFWNIETNHDENRLEIERIRLDASNSNTQY